MNITSNIVPLVAGEHVLAVEQFGTIRRFFGSEIVTFYVLESTVPNFVGRRAEVAFMPGVGMDDQKDLADVLRASVETGEAFARYTGVVVRMVYRPGAKIRWFVCQGEQGDRDRAWVRAQMGPEAAQREYESAESQGLEYDSVEWMELAGRIRGLL